MRRATGDDGLSLIETVAALIVFALIMSGLAAGMALFAHTTELTKVRSSATTMAQQIAEAAKTIPLNQLAVCTGGGQPASSTFQGTSYTVVSGTTPCVQYTSTRTGGNGITFTITQLVLKDPTWDVTVNSQPISKRLFVVTVAWSVPSAGSYTTNTLISGKNTLAAQTPVGLRININDGSGNLVTAPNLVWDYTVTNSSNVVVATNGTDDGTSGLLSVSPGTYTCSATPEQDAGSSYDPGTNPGLTITAATETISGSCVVNANAITDWNTVWNEVTDCQSSTTQKAASVAITVTDQSGNKVGGAAVTLTNSTTGAVYPASGSVTTDNTTGVATFSGSNAPLADLYTFSISKTGYQTSTGLGPICVAQGVANSAPGSIKVLSTCVVSKSKGSLTLTVRDETGATVSGAKVVLTNLDGQGSPGSVNSNPSGVAFFNNNVLGGNYSYTITKAGYTNLGPQTPLCVTVSPNNTLDPGLLPTQNYIGCATGGHATWVVSAVDANLNPLSGVKMTLTNANGHGGVPGAKTTDSTGTVTFTNVPTDLYLITPSILAGYADPGVQGPVCVQSQSPAMTTQVNFTGIMTVKVTISNTDTQPSKSYTVSLTDSGGQITTNTITINKNKSGTVTFANMPTDTYTINACVAIAATGNCNPINNTTTTYAFTTKGFTYQSPNPPTFTDTSTDGA